MGKRSKNRWDDRLRIIPRDEWGARAPKDRVRIDPPAKLYVHHSVGECPRDPRWTERVFFKAACRFVREVQAFHMDVRGWSDAGYSFMVLKPWFRRMWVFELRGWGVQGAHTEGSNSTSIGVCVAGNYMTSRAGFRLVYTIRRLIERGLKEGHLRGPRTSLPTGGHQDAPDAATQCPGTNLQKKVPAMRKPTARWKASR